MPIEAKAREVRSQAKKVRSGEHKSERLHQDKMGKTRIQGENSASDKHKEVEVWTHQEQGDLWQHSPYSPTPQSRISRRLLSTNFPHLFINPK